MRVAFLALALLAPFESCDHAVRDWAQSHRSGGLDRASRFLSDLGKPQTVFALLLAGCVVRPDLGVAAARVALIALVPTNVVTEIVKRVTFRARPDGEHRRSNASFPSSHAANAFAMAAVLSRFWRRLSPGVWLFAAAIAASRVELDRHYASDVLVGAAIGIASAWIAIVGARRWRLATEAPPVPRDSRAPA